MFKYQSGNGKNATQTNSSIQPRIPSTGGIMDLTTNNPYFNLSDGTVPSGNSAYTVSSRHGVINNLNGVWLASGTPGTNNANNTFRRMTNAYRNYWWGNDSLIPEHLHKHQVLMQ